MTSCSNSAPMTLNSEPSTTRCQGQRPSHLPTVSAVLRRVTPAREVALESHAPHMETVVTVISTTVQDASRSSVLARKLGPRSHQMGFAVALLGEFPRPLCILIKRHTNTFASSPVPIQCLAATDHITTIVATLKSSGAKDYKAPLVTAATRPCHQAIRPCTQAIRPYTQVIRPCTQEIRSCTQEILSCTQEIRSCTQEIGPCTQVIRLCGQAS
jgi:hypothetical protein